MVEKYIRDLLFNYDCVVLPDFGGFLTHYVGADIHPITHKFLPPSKKVAFNEQLKLNDGLLVSAITEGEKISREKAVAAISEYVEEVNAGLGKYNQFIFEGVGKVFYNLEQRLEFEPDVKANFLDDSFGFSELYFKPIDKEFTTMNKVQPQGNRPAMAKKDATQDSTFEKSDSSGKSVKIFLFVAIPILLMVGAAAFLFTQKDNEFLSGIWPMSSKEVEKKEVVKEVEGTKEEVEEESFVAEEIVEENEEVAAQPMVTDINGTYYIIIGSFKNSDNAYNLQKKLSTRGGNGRVLEPKKDSFYKVAVAGFETLDAAATGLELYRAQYGSDVWVVKY